MDDVSSIETLTTRMSDTDTVIRAKWYVESYIRKGLYASHRVKAQLDRDIESYDFILNNGLCGYYLDWKQEGYPAKMNKRRPRHFVEDWMKQNGVRR